MGIIGHLNISSLSRVHQGAFGIICVTVRVVRRIIHSIVLSQPCPTSPVHREFEITSSDH